MAAFHFSLEQVLELRLREEHKQARAMADASRDANAARQAVQDLEALRSAGRARLTAAHSTGRSVGQLQNLEWVLGRMETELEAAQDKARDAATEASRCRKEFQRAVRDRQSIDRLKERKRSQWIEEEKRVEQKAMDELALTRHFRGEHELATGAEDRS
jgi:flagellar FliJ protein